MDKPYSHVRGSVLSVIIVALLLLAVCIVTSLEHATSENHHKATFHVLTYCVTGSATKAALTYHNAEGGTAQANTSLPWQKQILVTNGFPAYLSAQNLDNAGSVKAEIRLNGDVVKISVGSGAHVTALSSRTVDSEYLDEGDPGLHVDAPAEPKWRESKANPGAKSPSGMAAERPYDPRRH